MESLKIFHLSDTHIGMKFQRYPDRVREALIEARYMSIDQAISIANECECQILAVTGDLFESVKVKQKDVVKTAELFHRFEGEYIWILPGNHDYYDASLKLWQWFMEKAPGHLVLMRESRLYDFDLMGSKIHVYAAPCASKHSKSNNLSWIKERALEDGINILMAHGAIKEISPDLNNAYFPMTFPELRSLNMTVCLVGHTHVPYPLNSNTVSETIFNAGTSEPDGLNYKHEGAGWLIKIDEDGVVEAERKKTGHYRYRDLSIELSESIDEEEILTNFDTLDLDRTIGRITFKGYLSEEAYAHRFEKLDALKEKFLYLEVRTHDLKPKFTKEMIERAFSSNSVPYKLLQTLLEENDEEVAYLAYDLMMEGIEG